MACVVGLDVDMSVVVGCKLVGVGPVLGNVACEDPQNMRCLALHVVGSLWDVFA